jgi:hypothetical protein
MWQRLPICFELLSPIHLGFLPKNPGTVVAPTRPYVPGKNLWGSITASLAPRLYSHPRPDHFAAIGDDIRKCLAFSYFYLSDGQKVLAPSYEGGVLNWAEMSNSEFRGMFLDSRLSTQIGETGAAEDGSLHEIEFIRHKVGAPAAGVRKVLLCGVMWAQTESTIVGRRLLVEGTRLRLDSGDVGLDLLDALTVGGERNYGFGRIRSCPLTASLTEKLEDLWPDEPGTPFLLSRPLLGHAVYRQNVPFRGQVEIVASRAYPVGRDRSYEAPGAAVSTSGYFFAPGTWLLTTKCHASVDSLGQVSLIAV